MLAGNILEETVGESWRRPPYLANGGGEALPTDNIFLSRRPLSGILDAGLPGCFFTHADIFSHDAIVRTPSVLLLIATW